MSRERILDQLGEGVVESFDPGLRRAFDFADSQIDPSIKDPEKLKFHEDKIKVSGDGVFYTLQGEGVTMGEPAVFLRTHVCNLRCTWCDAWYTWNPQTPEFWTEPQDLDIGQVADMVENAWAPTDTRIQKRLIITGGEPMIQQEQIIKLMDELNDYEEKPQWTFEIETNGTIMPDDRLIEAGVQFNCSPKLSNSLNGVRSRIRPDVIKRLAEGNTRFKFVVMSNEDLDEIERDWVDGIGIHPEQVILMPQGVTAEEVHMNSRRVAEYAKIKGYRLLGRLQNEIWGARRGV